MRLEGSATIRVPTRPFLGLKEVAVLFGVSTKTVERWVSAGEFPVPRTINGRTQWTAMQIGVWLAFVDHCELRRGAGHRPDTGRTKAPKPADGD